LLLLSRILFGVINIIIPILMKLFEGRNYSREVLAWVLIPALPWANDLTLLNVTFVENGDHNTFHTELLEEIVRYYRSVPNTLCAQHWPLTFHVFSNAVILSAGHGGG
jgi:hypothetical protein